jgi:serine O-acetyltransferase
VVSNQNPNSIGFWDLLREDFVAHKSDWGRLGYRALVVHRFGNWRMGVTNPILRVPLSVLYRALFRHCRASYGIEIPYSVKLGRRVAIEHHSGIILNGGVVMGDDVVLRQNTTIGVRSAHDVDANPIIGNGVEIGAGAVILGGLTIGDGATIGANAVVLNDVPAGALAVGVPARIVDRAGGSNGTAQASSTEHEDPHHIGRG